MTGIAKTRWGWTLFYEGEIVASSDHADSLWPLAQRLDVSVTA